MKTVVSECPIEQTMQIISGRWPTQIIYYLKDGTKRFSDLQKDNPAISQRMLSLELKKLESTGVIIKTVYEGFPLKVEYDLSPAGKKLAKLVDELGDWWEETLVERESSGKD